MVPASIDRFTLSNGLRVLYIPDYTTPVAAVSIHYDIGSRSEPEGLSGFAHLFEHMMFTGSESVAKHQHPRLVQAAGGLLNGSTTPDFTVYYEVVPVEALRTVLFLEADRMRAPLLDPAELPNQVNVVKEEVRTRLLGRAYGKFPERLASVMYETFPNSHDGWGDFASLESATLDECAAFFDTYYSPGNALLTVTGPVSIGFVMDHVHRYFDDIPARPVPPRPDFDEPPPTGSRRTDMRDSLIPLMALAIGYRLPDPITHTDEYLSYLVLADVLADGLSSRLQRRLLHVDGIANSVTAEPLNGPFGSRHPDTFAIAAYAAPRVTAEQILDAVDDELRRVVAHPPIAEEITKSVTRQTVSVHEQLDDPAERVKGLGMFELLHGSAELLTQLPHHLATVTSERVAAAAAMLSPDSRAILALMPTRDDL